MLPSIFRNSFFDNLLDSPFDRALDPPLFSQLMKTDVKETESTYEIDIDMPGFKKEDIQIQLDHGTLKINAKNIVENEEKDEKKNYIRRERYSGSCSRSFYVGDQIKQEDIKAKLKDGILNLSIPKIDQAEIESAKAIQIE